MSTVLAILLAVLCAWLLLKPHLAGASLELRSASAEHENLLEQKERCVQVLKDLELDFQTQKVSAADYQHMRESMSLELASILQKLDRNA